LTDPLDTNNFPKFPSSNQFDDEALQLEMSAIEEQDKEYPKWRGRRLRQTDIPFIGFTYKNLAAVSSLLASDASVHPSTSNKQRNENE